MPANQVGREAVTVSTTAIGLTVPASAKHAIIQVSTSPIRWCASEAPTSTTGIYISAGGTIEFMEVSDTYSGILRNIQFIRDTSAGADATIEVAYFD